MKTFFTLASLLLVLSISTIVKAQTIPDLIITEIMYNGPESGTDTTEFIEIYNNDTMSVNLNGYYFIEGVTYTFPNVTIAAGDYFVVVYDSVKFLNAFGVNAYEWTSDGLSNGGEDIILVTNNGDTVDVVDYDDGGVWPNSADGDGPSLSFCNYSLDNNNGANWSASTTFAGKNSAGDSIWATPGAACGTSAIVVDTISPIVLAAIAVSDTVIKVVYNEVVDSTAENINNYTGISSISSATLESNMKSVNLSLSSALVAGQLYNLTINNVKDTAQNAMVAAQTFSVIYTVPVGDTISPIVVSAMALSDTTIKVVYSEAVDTTANNINNYTGIAGISSAMLNAASTEVMLSLSTALVSGQAYNLTINNVKDSSQNIMDSAQTFAIVYTAPLPGVISKLVITEIMYKSEGGNGDKKEFIEIYNNDTVAINLANYEIIEGVEITFPAVTLAAGDYIVTAKDSSEMLSFFGVTAYEWTSGSLKNSGEDIILVNNVGDTLDIVDYSNGGVWPSEASGNGPSLTLCNPNMDNNNGANWLPSINFVGVNANNDSIWATPGAACTYTPAPPSADTIAPVPNNAVAIAANKVEVFFDEPVDISGESIANYGGLGTITSAVRNANGDVVTLTLTNTLTDGDNNILTVSNIKDTSNNTMPNAVILNFIYNSTIADLVINEIMYNDITAADSLEYFEIYNNSTSDANISGYEVTEGVDYIFPANTVIPSHGFLVVAKNANLINSVFNITGTHQWTSGGLKNSGEDIEIRNTVGDVIDYVDYDDANPWPVEADGDGYALELHAYSDDNNDGANWFTFNAFYAIYNGDTIYGTPGRDNIYESIEENSALNSIKIYPNPATNRVNVKTEQGNYMVKIYSISGSLVKEVEISNSNSIISVESLETGIYMMMFVEEKTGAVGYRKLIVE